MRAVNHPALDRAVRQAAGKAGVRLQEFAFNSGGYATDAVAAGAAGVATVTLCLPRRYSHSPVEVMSMNTAVETEKLVEHLLLQEVDLRVW